MREELTTMGTQHHVIIGASAAGLEAVWEVSQRLDIDFAADAMRPKDPPNADG